MHYTFYIFYNIKLFKIIIVVKRQARQILLAKVLCSLFQEARARDLKTPSSPCHADQKDPIRLLPIERLPPIFPEVGRNRTFISPTFTSMRKRKRLTHFSRGCSFIINKSYPRRIYSLRLKLICSIMDGENRC